VASSSRSQVQAPPSSAAACLAWDRPFVGVRWRPPPSVAIVIHFVTQLLTSRVVSSCCPRTLSRSARERAFHPSCPPVA